MAGPWALWRAARGARRLYPVAAMAYERWKSLSPEEKERYRRRARETVDRGVETGRRLVQEQQQRRRRR